MRRLSISISRWLQSSCLVFDAKAIKYQERSHLPQALEASGLPCVRPAADVMGAVAAANANAVRGTPGGGCA
eukprot:scaffold6760_cov119-Isochrysis_galbana.AAC.14